MEKLQPKLRFTEFTDTWKKTTINDICNLNPSSTNLPDTFIYIDLESVNNGVLEKKNQVDLIEAPSRARRLLKVGDVLFQMVRPYQKNNYHFNLSGDYVASTGYAQMRSVGNSGFLFQYLHTQKFVDNVIEKCTGSNYPAINSSDLSEIIVSFPTLPEQTKIASFLTTVDEKISGLKKQLNLLERYKKGVMQKIFSQELRFKDENGNDFPDWEEKKLGEVMEERNTQHPKSIEYPLMSFVANKGITEKGERYDREFLVSDELNKKYKRTEFGDFIYSSNNLETGSIGLNRFGFSSISPVYSIFKIINGSNFIFIGEYLRRKKFISKMIRYRQGVVYGQWRIHEKDFLQIADYFPHPNEQQKIATFLSSIDEKLEKCQGQIKAMENWKKGLLQQMFV